VSDLHELFGRASAGLWPALADHLWQATLFALLILSLTALLGRARARVRYSLWLIAAAKFLLPSALFAAAAAQLNPYLPTLSAGGAEAGTALILFVAAPVSNALEVTAGAVAPHAEIYCVLSLLWLGGCALSAVVWWSRRRAALRVLGRGREVRAGREFEAMERARRRLGLKREVRLVLAQGPHGPGLWHARRPSIVLPEELAGRLDDEELEAVMLHELAHAERRDNLAALFQAAVCCVFWFHPLTWLVGRRLLEERERACDERVLEAGGAPASYASGILKVVRLGLGWKAAGASGATDGTNLRRRIEMIMSGERNRPAARWQRALPLAAGLAALCLTLGPALFGGTGAAALTDGAGQQAGGAGVALARQAAQGATDSPAIEEITRAPEFSVLFEHAVGAPLGITNARMRLVSREQLRRAADEGADYFDEDEAAEFFLTLPEITLANQSLKTIREVGVGFATDGRVNVVAGYAASIKPGESQTFRPDWRRRNVILPGTPERITVRLVWATMDDGTTWGAKPPAPPAPPRPAAPPQPPNPSSPRALSRFPSTGNPASPEATGGAGSGGAGGQVSGGALNGRVVSKPAPVYPATAKRARAQGVVTVRIVIGEDGQVVSAEAASGHPLLHEAATQAALAARFTPTLSEGKPVKVAGAITYNFVLNDEEANGARP